MSQIKLQSPLQVTSRLMPGFRIPGDTGGTVHLQAERYTNTWRVAFHYIVEDASGTVLDEGTDLETPIHSEDASMWYPSAAAALAGFLYAYGEHYRYQVMGRRLPWSDSLEYPNVSESLAEWCYLNSDELAMIEEELEPSENDE